MFDSGGPTDDIDLTRSWMLPVFRDHTQETQLAFFAEYFLPLASQLKLKCKMYLLYVHVARSIDLFDAVK